MDLSRHWRFDESVANVFDDHARQNIPGYEQVIDLSIRVVKAVCQPQDRIAEVGCATGYTLKRLEDVGFTNIVGIDSSEAMLEKCVAKHAKLIHSEKFPTDEGLFQAVLMNWTLHFVPLSWRAAYLESVRASLPPGGVLVL